MIDTKWLDKWGMLVGNDEKPSDNAILLTAYKFAIDNLLNNAHTKYEIDQLLTQVFQHLKSKGRYKQLPDRPNDPASHDNVTGMMAILFVIQHNHYDPEIKHVCRKLIRELKVIGHYWHPRDIGYYWYLKGGMYKVASYPFYLVTLISMYFSCRRDYETRNDMALISTSSKLLAFIRVWSLYSKSSLMRRATEHFKIALSRHRDIEDHQRGVLVSIDTFMKCFLFYLPNQQHPIYKAAYKLFKQGL